MKKFLKFEWIFLAMVLIFALSCGGFYAYSRAGLDHVSVETSGKDALPAPRESDPAPGLLEGEKININTAPAEELERLPGIGESRAAAIVAYREEHGPFTSEEDLLNVSGIGEGILNKVRDYIALEDTETEEDHGENSGGG